MEPRLCERHMTIFLRTFLTARSSVFSEMFTSVADEVTITDVNVSVMKLVLQFIYTGQIDLSNCNVMEVLQCAEKFDLNELKTVCFNEMCD